jgi:hypothetical protein
MKKMNVADAAAYFGVSREAIHNRIRRGSLESVVENGVKMVVVDAKAKKTTKQAVQSKNNDERYYKLLEEQNAKLQSRVEALETETRTLRDQKELMLIEERKKIEQIYKEKDEQLKNILTTLSSQFMLSAPEPQEELVEAEIEEPKESKSGIISLKKYLKNENYTKAKAKKVKQRFQKKVLKDERVIEIDGKFYLDLVKYDYKGLL